MSHFSVALLKSFHYLMTPLGLAMSLWVLALLTYGFTRFTRLSKMLAICPILLLWFLATPYTANWLFNTYIAAHPIPYCQSTTACQYDVIIVAGWMKAYHPDDPKVNMFWSERLWQASQIQEENTQIIIVSSQYPTPFSPQKEQQTYARIQLEKWGVASDQIIITAPGRTTREAMLLAHTQLQQLQASSALLIDYSLRLPRKFKSLKKIVQKEKTNIKLLAHATLLRTSGPAQNTQLKDWLPNEKTLLQSRVVIHEIAGLIGYTLNRWV